MPRLQETDKVGRNPVLESEMITPQVIAEATGLKEIEKQKKLQTGKEQDYMYPQIRVNEYVELLMSKTSEELLKMSVRLLPLSKETKKSTEAVEKQGPTRNEELQILAALRTINTGQAIITDIRYSMGDLVTRYKKVYGIAPDLK
jgi:hypothetical protein